MCPSHYRESVSGGSVVNKKQTCHIDLTSSFPQHYLSRFYNLNLRQHRAAARRVRSSSAREEKIREMQSFFGLSETGNLDSPTLNVMREPRCGVSDVDNYSFYPNKPKWENHTITYM